MTYIDPHQPEGDYLQRREARREAEARQQREAMGEPTFDDVLFRRGSTYSGTPAQIGRLAARAGRPVETAAILRQRLEGHRAADDLLPED